MQQGQQGVLNSDSGNAGALSGADLAVKAAAARGDAHFAAEAALIDRLAVATAGVDVRGGVGHVSGICRTALVCARLISGCLIARGGIGSCFHYCCQGCLLKVGGSFYGTN